MEMNIVQAKEGSLGRLTVISDVAGECGVGRNLKSGVAADQPQGVIIGWSSKIKV